MTYKVPFIRPTFPDKEKIAEDYASILESNWFTNFGPFESRLCSEIAKLYDGGTARVTTIANATLGLQAAVDTLLDKKSTKKEVIVPSFTFASGPEVLIRAGFRPIFIDIEVNTWQPSLKQASDYLEKNKDAVAGILLCNSFGVGNTAIGSWERLAADYSLPLIIDSAAGFGSMYSKDELVGARGDCEIFSMHATKPFAVGEGGLIVSRSNELISKVREYQNFGFAKDRQVHQLGTNAKLQELNCAIGLRQLDGFMDRLESRRNTLMQYSDSLPQLTFIENSQLSTVAFAPAIAQSSDAANKIVKSLEDGGVEVRQYYSPLHLQTGISQYTDTAGSLKNTENIASQILSLPVHDNMDESSLELVISIIKSCEE